MTLYELDPCNKHSQTRGDPQETSSEELTTNKEYSLAHCHEGSTDDGGSLNDEHGWMLILPLNKI